MGLTIEDGNGKGVLASVTSEHRLAVESVVSTVEHYANHHSGNAYSVIFSQSPTASGDCIFYLKNEDELDLCIEGVVLGVTDCTANDSIYFKVGGEGTRNGATDLTPINLNAGSGKTAEGTFEKGADLDGAAVTFSGGKEFERIVLAGVTDLVSKPFNFEQDLILPKNLAMSIWVDGSGTGTYYLTIYFNYHKEESI